MGKGVFGKIFDFLAIYGIRIRSEEIKMKKVFAGVPILLFLILSLTGCNAVGDKSSSLSVIYGATAVLSLFLFVGCIFSVRKKRFGLSRCFHRCLL